MEYPETVKAGETTQISLKIENMGVVPIYNKLPLKLRIKGKKMQEYITDVDIRKWLPGEHTEAVYLDAPIKEGEYELRIELGGGKYPIVQFINEGEVDGRCSRWER